MARPRNRGGLRRIDAERAIRDLGLDHEWRQAYERFVEAQGDERLAVLDRLLGIMDRRAALHGLYQRRGAD